MITIEEIEKVYAQDYTPRISNKQIEWLISQLKEKEAELTATNTTLATLMSDFSECRAELAKAQTCIKKLESELEWEKGCHR